MKTDLEHHRWQWKNWEHIPKPLRGKCVEHLQRSLTIAEELEIKELAALNPDSWWVEEHLLSGMWVRNILREIIKDGQLPPVLYDDGKMYQNWDDFYIAAIEEAVGILRPSRSVLE